MIKNVIGMIVPMLGNHIRSTQDEVGETVRYMLRVEQNDQNVYLDIFIGNELSMSNTLAGFVSELALTNPEGANKALENDSLGGLGLLIKPFAKQFLSEKNINNALKSLKKHIVELEQTKEAKVVLLLTATDEAEYLQYATCSETGDLSVFETMSSKKDLGKLLG